MRRAVFTSLFGAALLVACRDSAPGEARIEGSRLVASDRTVELPAADVATPQVAFDASHRRFAYPAAGGGARVIYAVGDGLFVGPIVGAPVDFKAVPPLANALAPLFETAGPRRSALLAAIAHELGEIGVARLLYDAAYVDDGAWNDARKTLDARGEALLDEELAHALELGRSDAALRRAVLVMRLDDRRRSKLVAWRARELVVDHRLPRIAAILLRASIPLETKQAKAMACEALVQPGADPDDAFVAEAAFLTLASTHETCKEELRLPLGDACDPRYRCDGAPCTKADLGKAVARELAVAPAAILERAGARADFFAYAWLALSETLPPAFDPAKCAPPLKPSSTK